MLKRRREIIEKYDSVLKPLGIEVLRHYTKIQFFRTLIHNKDTRDHAGSETGSHYEMAEAGVACNVHYKPLPMMTAYKNMGFDIKDYPNAYERFVNEVTLRCIRG